MKFICFVNVDIRLVESSGINATSPRGGNGPIEANKSNYLSRIEDSVLTYEACN